MPAPFAGCPKCSAYAKRRAPRLFPEIKRAAASEDLDPMFKAARFFSRVHQRHLEGKAL